MTLLNSRFTSRTETIVFGDRRWVSGDKGGQLLNASYWSHGKVKRLDPKLTQHLYLFRVMGLSSELFSY